MFVCVCVCVSVHTKQLLCCSVQKAISTEPLSRNTIAYVCVSAYVFVCPFLPAVTQHRHLRAPHPMSQSVKKECLNTLLATLLNFLIFGFGVGFGFVAHSATAKCFSVSLYGLFIKNNSTIIYIQSMFQDCGVHVFCRYNCCGNF